MTLVKHDSGGFWVSGPLVAALVTIIFGCLWGIYQFENNRLWEDGNDIVLLKTSMTNIANENTRLESTVSSMDQSLVSILGEIRGGKDAIDSMKDQLHELQKQVSDLDSVLRPRTVPGEH